MSRYVLDGETLHDAVIHAQMMAGAEAQGGARDIGYVIICKRCGEPIGDHMNGKVRCLP